jgi:hypothetical protein
MFLLSLLYTTKDFHKLLVQKSYDEYDFCYNKYAKKYSNEFGVTYTFNEIEKMGNENIIEWRNDHENLEELEKILINNILCFCKNYPDEPVNKSRYIKEYKEFPYRLEQNLKSVMLDINGEINCFTII